jgi:hypothetical protein
MQCSGLDWCAKTYCPPQTGYLQLSGPCEVTAAEQSARELRWLPIVPVCVRESSRLRRVE